MKILQIIFRSNWKCASTIVNWKLEYDQLKFEPKVKIEARIHVIQLCKFFEPEKLIIYRKKIFGCFSLSLSLGSHHTKNLGNKQMGSPIHQARYILRSWGKTIDFFVIFLVKLKKKWLKFKIWFIKSSNLEHRTARFLKFTDQDKLWHIKNLKNWTLSRWKFVQIRTKFDNKIFFKSNLKINAFYFR